jgi:uncharacterized membrane protein YsdA (DUF1294 family)
MRDDVVSAQSIPSVQQAGEQYMTRRTNQQQQRPRRAYGSNRRRMSPFWLFGGIALVSSAVLLVGVTRTLDWPLIITCPVVLTPITFFFFWFDKRQARGNGLRIPEVVLLLLALGGGFAGGFLAMKLLRHKTQHRQFWLAQGAGLVLWAGLLWWL